MLNPPPWRHVARNGLSAVVADSLDALNLGCPWKLRSRRPFEMPIHPFTMIALSALEVLGDDIDGLILVVSVVENMWRDQPTPLANWADNHDDVARCQVR